MDAEAGLSRRAARVDANQKDIVAALRGVGASVTPIHTVGQGCPDLLVGYRGKNFLFEVKDGAKPPSARQLTDDEAVWFGNWKGEAHVIESAQQAVDVVLRGQVSYCAENCKRLCQNSVHGVCDGSPKEGQS